MNKIRLLIAVIFLSIVSCTTTLDNYILPSVQPDLSLELIANNINEIIANKVENDKPLLIQLYGQSIVRQMDDDYLIDRLTSLNDDLEVNVINSSRSGLQVPALLEYYKEDIYSQQPDVLIFHAYGGTLTGELELLFKDLKENFKGQVITFNHHLSYATDVKHNNNLLRVEDESSAIIKQLGKKYAFGFIDVRSNWRLFLELNPQLNASDLLKDVVHPNVIGSDVLDWIIVEHLITALENDTLH